MAISKSFFGLRSGSTKSLTFSTYRGQQVTKDRVTAINNPQSEQQMKQRLLVPMVASARAALKDLVNHSFEGVSYGEESLKTFSALNLSKGALNVISYVPKGAATTGQADFIISRGSLTPIILETGASDGGAYTKNCTITNVKLPKATDELTPFANGTMNALYLKQLLADNPILSEGDQLTFLLQYAGDEFEFQGGEDNPLGGYYDRFLISRLILDTNTRQEWTRETGASNSGITDGFIKISQSTLTPVYSLAEGKLMAGCAILSRKNDTTWLRSTARMTDLSNSNGEYAIGYDEAVYSYLKTTSRSAKYLNSGTDGVGITGGK